MVGIVGGLGAYIFRVLINGINFVLFKYPSSLAGRYSILIIILSPAIGAFFVGILVYYGAREAKGHGVPEVIEAVNLNDAKMRARVPFTKIIASAVTIGSNGSAGREGPIAQIGGGFASILGTKLRLPKDDHKTLVIAGVSSGIAATFNAPLGGILFGYEIIRRDQRDYSIWPLVISSVIGTIIGQILLGSSPAFIFPHFTLNRTANNIPFLLIFGLIIGILGVLWVKSFYLIENGFEKLPLHPITVTVIGGLLIGLLELLYPEVSGINYDPINSAFNLEFGIQTLIFLFLAKIIATSISIGSGGSGGVFAPSLFQGVMIGSAFGLMIAEFGNNQIPIEIYALLGMAGIFATTTKAPLTAIVMTSEMVNDFELIIPIMLVVSMSWIVSELTLDKDIYILKLAKRGIEFTPSVDILDDFNVEETMITDVVTVSPKDRIETILDLMMETSHTGFPVTNNGRLMGIITEHDVDKALQNPKLENLIVSEVCRSRVVYVLPKQTLAFAFSLMGKNKINRLPVVDSKASLNLLGWITRSDIMRQYFQAKSLKLSEQYSDEMLLEWENQLKEEVVDVPD